MVMVATLQNGVLSLFGHIVMAFDCWPREISVSVILPSMRPNTPPMKKIEVVMSILQVTLISCVINCLKAKLKQKIVFGVQV